MLTRRTLFEVIAALVAIVFIVSGHQQPAPAPAPPVASGVRVATPVPTIPVARQPTPVVAGPAISGPFDAYVQEQVRTNSFSGSVLVARGHQVLLRRGYGLANREFNIPNTPQTKFRIGSLTKGFTAMSIMILQQRGKLHVQDPVCMYISNCPASWHLITIRHLLTHESGLASGPSPDELLQAAVHNWSPAQWLPTIEAKPLVSQPGSKYSYNSMDYIVLSAIIERVSGTTFEHFLQENIFAPLGMADTGVDHTDENGAPILTNRASGYIRNGAAIGNDGFYPAEYLYGAGSLYSTIDDMYRWGRSFSTDQLVPKAAIDQIFTPNLGDYGFGWQAGSLSDGHLGGVHTGVIGGFRSIMGVVPDEGLTVVVLANIDVDNSVLYTMANQLGKMALKK